MEISSVSDIIKKKSLDLHRITRCTLRVMAALAPNPAPRSVLTQLNCTFVCGAIGPGVAEVVAARG